MFDEEGVRRLSSLVGMHEGFARVFLRGDAAAVCEELLEGM